MADAKKGRGLCAREPNKNQSTKGKVLFGDETKEDKISLKSWPMSGGPLLRRRIRSDLLSVTRKT
jgi:hypothetical protein